MEPNSICDGNLRKRLIENARLELVREYPNDPIISRSSDFFSDEFMWISRLGIVTLDDYIDVKRIGRRDSRVARKNRPKVFAAYEKYIQLREQAGKQYDWDDLASAVRNEFKNDNDSRLYKHIVIDEGQDFSPEMIRSIVKAISKDGSITFFGDIAQQIYGHRMTWRSAGLNVKKVWKFKDNFRNSKQIAKFGLAISKMPYFSGTADLVEPIAPKADGPLPTLVECSTIGKEAELVAKLARSIAKTQSVVILLRKREYEEFIEKLLPDNKVRLHKKNLTEWVEGPGVFYGTYHAAKGLEFDSVLLPFCGKNRLPDPERIKSFGSEETAIEDGRLFYVGVTRAKTKLIITYSGSPTPLMPDNDGLYKGIKI